MKNESFLLEKYLPSLNLDILNAERIIHEDTLSSCIYKLILKNGLTYILKISYDNNRWKREKFFLKDVKSYIPVPKLISTIDPTKDRAGAILMEFLDGDIITLKNFTDKISYEMGVLLGKLHNIPAHFYGDITKDLLKPNLSNGKLILSNYFEESFNECKNVLEKNLLENARAYFYKSLDEIKYLDGPSIVHTDFKPGNIIYKNDQIIGLIDWENAKYSFCEEDFLRMEFLVWDTDSKYRKDFFKGYESVRKIPHLDLIMPILKIAKALGAIGFTIERKTYQKEHKSIFDQNLIYLQNFLLKNK